MALSRIWSAFIIIAVVVALLKSTFSGDKDIFSRMVVGRADDPYQAVTYMMVGSPEQAGYTSKTDFGNFLSGYGYVLTDTPSKAQVLITDKPDADSAASN